MTNDEFCRIMREFDGEPMDNVGQLAHIQFTGEELKEFCDHVEQQVKNCLIADVVECAGNKRTPHEKRSEVLSNPLWEYKDGLYKHFKWGYKTLDEAYKIATL